MQKSNRLSRAYKASKKLAVRTGAAVSTMALTAGTAFAQSTDMPATIEGAAAFMTTKGGIAIAVAAAITLIVLGIRGAKLPRQG